MTPSRHILIAALGLSLAGLPATTQGKGKDGTKGEKQKHRVEQSASGRACPPGLGKKTPSCVPPGQAKNGNGFQLRAGASLEGRDYTRVRSWQYGLEPAPPGMRYAVYRGTLVLIDEDTAEIIGLIRAVEAIAD